MANGFDLTCGISRAMSHNPKCYGTMHGYYHSHFIDENNEGHRGWEQQDLGSDLGNLAPLGGLLDDLEPQSTLMYSGITSFNV